MIDTNNNADIIAESRAEQSRDYCHRVDESTQELSGQSKSILHEGDMSCTESNGLQRPAKNRIKVICCKLNKMPEGKLTSLNNAEICDLYTPTASTVTSRYYKGLGAHKDNMVLEIWKR